ncbi:L-ribulose-5-phosphate 3-epimerase UlaE [bioreactor metagenome]|uniref:L-ribulose-5-phosphate 3-epimerase UlaE n=1 Tax=bioreactor metagenome TaxID=1076179 RepID=A0A644Z3X6_9ZZZZ|nr:sugar phosphate isomerase/epimerase family protein [Oscillospiraceae bacterium]
MKKGINIWSFPSGMTLSEKIVMAKKAGFEGIELSLDEEGELSLKSGEKELGAIKKLASDTGISLPSLASGLYWGNPITSSDPAIRKRSAEITKRQLEAASILGCRTILVLPGVVNADFIPGCEIVEYDVAYERALNGFRTLSETAKEYGVYLCLENVWNKFLLSPIEMKTFIDEIGSEYVCSYLDVGNTIAFGYPEHWIKILGTRIKSVHFKDYRSSVGTLGGFVDLLAGDVNYPAVVNELNRTGYDGWVFGEMIPAYNHYSDQIIYNTSASMDRILSGK